MIKLEKIKKPKAANKIITSIGIKKDDLEFIKKNKIVLTKLVEEAIKELREGGNNGPAVAN